MTNKMPEESASKMTAVKKELMNEIAKVKDASSIVSMKLDEFQNETTSKIEELETRMDEMVLVCRNNRTELERIA